MGSFMENSGQLSNSAVRFYLGSSRLHIGFAESSVSFVVLGPTPPPWPESWDGTPDLSNLPQASPPQANLVRLTFDGSNRVVPEGVGELAHRSHFFLGNDASKWRTDVRSYREVVYRDLYPGIDLVYRVTARGLKYEFRVGSGTDPAAIRASFEGIETLAASEGGLVAHTPLGEIHDGALLAFRDTGQLVACRFALRGPLSYGFDCEDRRPAGALTIDPLVYATFLGGAGWDGGFDVAVDLAGNAYVAGATESFDFPATAGSFSTGLRGFGDAFVAKFDPSGTPLFATYLGGTLDDTWQDVATALSLDSSGSVYVAGHTNATDFPVTPGALQTTFASSGRPGPCGGTPISCTDGFVAKLSPDGASLQWATYLGGTDSELVESLKSDSTGNVYVAGSTWSRSFPVTPGAFDTVHGENWDAFVAKLSPDGSALIWATLLGDTAPGFGNIDRGRGIALGDDGAVYVEGETGSADFPVTSGVFDTTRNGSSDVFAARLAADGSALVWATLLGGSGREEGTSFAVDSSSNAYVTGWTNSSDFPITQGAFDTACGSDGNCNGDSGDGFVSKLSADGSRLVWSTFLGGNNFDQPRSIQVDAGGTAYVVGETNSPDFPVTQGAFDTGLDGPWDAFFVRLNTDGTGSVEGTFLGGFGSDFGWGVAVGPNDASVLTGYTNSSDFPVTPGAFDTTGNGGFDAFLVVLGAGAPDLVLSPADIAFAPPGPVVSGDSVGVTATIHNDGTRNASRVWVRFHDGPPSPSNQVGPDQPIPGSLIPGESATASVVWVAGSPGIHTICAVADPQNNITESDETNNVACAMVEVLSSPDYVPVDAYPSGSVTVGVSLPVAFTVSVRNAGGSEPAAWATLAFANASTPGSPFWTSMVSPIPAGGVAGAFAATWISPGSPGTYAVTAFADYGNAVTESNETNNAHTWTIIIVPGPVTTLVVGTPNVTATSTYVTSSTSLSFSVVDPSGTGIRNTTYRVDGGSWTNFTASGPFALAGEGEHLLEWRSEDWAGNAEPLVSARLRVDNTPPSTSIAVGAPQYQGAVPYVTSTTPIVLSAADGGAIPVGLALTEWRVDGGRWSPYTSPLTLTGNDGARTIEYQSSDLLGNAEPVHALRVILDNTAPQTTTSPSAPPFPSGTRFSLFATDDGSGVNRTEYRIDGGDWIPYTAPLTVPEGEHTIRYRSVDRLGNAETERTLAVPAEVVLPVEPNWKPFVALGFSLVLLAVGAWSSRRAPWKGGKGRRAALNALALYALPFVVLEAGTGFVSLFSRILSIPPLLGVGTAVDLTTLLTGIAVGMYRGAKGRPPLAAKPGHR